MMIMFSFFKKYIIYIATMLAILELVSGIANNIGIECLFGFLISFIFACLVFFTDCKFFNKGCISDKSVFVLFGIGLLGIIFCILSFMKKNGGYTFISLSASTIFITEFVFIKIFDIREY